MLSENEESVMADEFYRENGVSALEDRLEEEFLLFKGSWL